MRQTEMKEVLAELDGGTLLDKIQTILSDVAANSVNHESKGKVTLNMTMQPIKGSSQVNLIVDVDYKRPRNRGMLSETYRVEHPVFVNQGGKITVLPENPLKMAAQRDAFVDDSAAEQQHRQQQD